ncbi:YfmQ family protein [Alicyclobacillus mengziensis]|uniref:Uncharacterized protein n=1 Tax=Alicyclobacillus mengziensis TaxID=2931921 RepID=A0A9X7Z8E6_9BACL|nr:YfmQ family protein [Alicyclobacillus mengziensis]QSO48121.1 hypothetical protein JZ786_03665 [Alicyclobacillus mengziensis]
MSLAVPFWNYFWHIVALIFILLACLPTNYWRRINKRFAIHQELVPHEATDMRHEERLIPPQLVEELIEAYNCGNFLYRKPVYAPPGDAPLTWRYPIRHESYAIYLNGPYLDVVKSRGRRTRVFTIQSDVLHHWMISRAN